MGWLGPSTVELGCFVAQDGLARNHQVQDGTTKKKTFGPRRFLVVETLFFAANGTLKGFTSMEFRQLAVKVHQFP